MENQLTDEEKSKVCALYIGCEVKAHSTTPVYLGLQVGSEEVDIKTMLAIPAIKLKLIPLELIGEEDCMVLSEIEGDVNVRDRPNRKNIVAFRKRFLSEYVEKDVRVFQYLIAKKYAVQLFFAPNHWANGKNAIELGIAIENIK